LRLAILSDIHSNLPALEAVVEAIDGSDAEQLWCLGDVVGYGAQPDECASLVSERCDLCLVGNHDLAVLGDLDVSAFSPAAADAVEWTKAHSAKQTLDFLRALKPADETREVGLYHASPRDPIWEYVLWVDQAAECMQMQSARVSLIGHSHVALFFVSPASRDGGKEEAPEADAGGVDEVGRESRQPDTKGAHAAAGTTIKVGEGRWLINPGSVGQPRDGDPRAAWLELDTDAWTATYHRVEYEIDRAAEAINEAELPGQLARRLYVGQ
jgi:predicted phosphodiesterase